MSDIIGHNEPLYIIICNSCKHFHFKNMKSFSCDAFDKIPNEIFDKNSHSKPLADQKNNIVYEPKN